jgi:plasmid stability protein
MAALTLKNIPEELLEKLRIRAEQDRRSLTQEILYILEQAVVSGKADPYPSLDEALRQADAWTRLAGSWISDRPVEEEIREIYDRRTEGRDVHL